MISIFSILTSIAGVFVIAPIEVSDNVRTVCTLVFCIGYFISTLSEMFRSDKIANLSEKIYVLEDEIRVLKRRDK